MRKSFGFSPYGYNQIVIFTDEKEFRNIVAANPDMEAIIQDSSHNVYIAGVKEISMPEQTAKLTKYIAIRAAGAGKLFVDLDDQSFEITGYRVKEIALPQYSEFPFPAEGISLLQCNLVDGNKLVIAMRGDRPVPIDAADLIERALGYKFKA